MKTCERVVVGVGPLEESKGQVKNVTGKQRPSGIQKDVRGWGSGGAGRGGSGRGSGAAWTGISKDSDFEAGKGW